MNVGRIGALCGAKTKEAVLPATTLKGKPKRAQCNRWANHDETHKQIRGADFVLLYEWGEDETASPDDTKGIR